MRWPKPVILLLHFRRLFGAAFFVVIILQKAVFHPILLPPQKSIQIDHMDGPENVLFHVGIGLFQFFQQGFCFLALGQALPALGFSLFGKPTGTLQKLQFVIPGPCDDSSSWTQYMGRISSIPG